MDTNFALALYFKLALCTQEDLQWLSRNFRALAFVPAIDVIACYEELINSLSDELVDDLSDFPHYFEKTWIGL